MLQILRSWSQDRLLRGVVKSSSYLFSSNTIAAALSFAQGIFATRLLGVGGYGLVSGAVIVFASNVNRLLSFRMSEVVVKHLGQALTEKKTDRAGALVKAAALAEAITSLVAYLVLLLLAPFAAIYFAKDSATAPLFAVYGLVLVANLVYETSTGVLQTTKRFDRLALVNLIQSIITAALIFAAFLFQGNVWHVLVAYLLGKTFAGVAVAVSAFRQLDVTLGRGWWKTSLSLLPDWKKVGRFAISTNLSGTVNLIVRDSETLIISFFMSTTEAGYFRLAQGIINLVMMPIDPFIGPIYSEVTRTVAEQQWATTRRLLKRVSAIAGAWTLAIGSGLALLGWWLIPFLYGSGTAPTYPALLILLIGYGIANTFQWNRSLLLAMGMATFPLVVAALAGLVKTALSFTLVPIAGYLTEAGILSAYFVVSIGILVWQGLRVLNRQSAIANQP